MKCWMSGCTGQVVVWAVALRGCGHRAGTPEDRAGSCEPFVLVCSEHANLPAPHATPCPECGVRSGVRFEPV